MILPILPFATSFAPFQAERKLATVEVDSAALWNGLLDSAKQLRKDFNYRTYDVSSIDETDPETGAPKPRSPEDLVILDLRDQLDGLVKEIKLQGKRRRKLESGELDAFARSIGERLVSLAESPFIQGLPVSLDERIRKTKDFLLQLLSRYSNEHDLSDAFDFLEPLFPAREKIVSFNSANHVCAMVSTPGDIILRKALLIDGKTDNDFGPRTMKVINFLESLKGGDQILNYRHSELISSIEHYNNIETISYYPWYFMIGKPEDEKKPMFMTMNKKNIEYMSYRSKYTAFRAKGRRFDLELEKKEGALDRLGSRVLFHRMGTCADFVNWAFHNTITSPWNRLPLIKHLIQMIYPPEALQTPDNLADSPDTEKVCEVENSNLAFPEQIHVKDWVNRTRIGLRSEDQQIQKHASNVWQFLIKNEVISADGELQAEIVKIQTKKF